MEERKPQIQAIVDGLGIGRLLDQYPETLAVGERQRAAIAAALAHGPGVVLADEPTGNLDPKLSAEIMAIFEQFNQVGVSVLVATHDLALIASMKHRIVMLRGGRLC